MSKCSTQRLSTCLPSLLKHCYSVQSPLHSFHWWLLNLDVDFNPLLIQMLIQKQEDSRGFRRCLVFSFNGWCYKDISEHPARDRGSKGGQSALVHFICSQPSPTSLMKASCHASEMWTVIFKNYAPTPHTYNLWSLQPSQSYFWSLPMPAVPGHLWALLRGWTAKEVVHSSSKNTMIQKLRTKLRDSVLPVNTVKPQNWYIVRKPHSFLLFIIFQLTPYSSFICAFIITSLQNSALSQAAE